MRRFEYSDGISNKFWEIEQVGCDLNICFGKIGTNGQSQTKTHPDDAKATAALDKLVREKTGKGYAEVGASLAASAPPKPAAPAEPVAPVAPVAVPVPVAVSSDMAPWLANGLPIDMPAKMLAQVLPSRRFPGTAPRADADASWALFLAYASQCKPVSFYSDVKELTAAGEEAITRIERGLRAGSQKSDVMLLAIDCVVEHKLKPSEGSPLVDYLVAARGLAYALNVLLDLQLLSIERDNYTNRYRASLRALKPFSKSRANFSPSELAIRYHLAVADQGLWDQCEQTIRNALPHIAPARQPLFGVLLPEIPALSNALAKAPQMENSVAWLRLSADAPDSLAAIRHIKPDVHGYYGSLLYYDYPAAVATLVRERGVDAVELLKDGATLAVTARALACIGTPASIRALAVACDADKDAIKRLPAAAQRWPFAAIAALSELIAADGTGPVSARGVLAGLVQVHAASLPAFKPWISAGAAQVLDDLAAEIDKPIETAQLSELPRVLANPPWLAPRKSAAAVLKLEPLTLAPVLQLPDGERARIQEQVARYKEWYSGRKSDRYAGAAQVIASGDSSAVIAFWRDHIRSHEADLIFDLPAPLDADVWNALAGAAIDNADHALVKLGLRALPGLSAMCEQRPGLALPAAIYVGAVELAEPVARSFAPSKPKASRVLARKWLLAWPEYAACGLIAVALGRSGAARDCAAGALRLLVQAGHMELLSQVAARYQQSEVSAALSALLEQDPLDLYPAKVPALSPLWTPQIWTRLVLADSGKALPLSVLDHIGTMLRFPVGESVYAGITQLKQACTARSLGQFAWDLFNTWLEAGADPKEGWAFTALGLLGDDEVARKLTPLLRAWPSEGLHGRAVNGLDVLALIGSDIALMLLNGIAQKSKNKPLQDRARDKVAQIAEARDLTPEELEDRLAPELGLDQQGTLLLDFGPRQFVVGFDEALKPYVRDLAGARLSDLPKPKQTDDAVLAEDAVLRYKRLKKDVRTIAAQQLRRLELAMCARRRWERDVFSLFLANHPLVRHLVHRLVWGAYRVGPDSAFGGELLACFRVGTDGEFTNADDDPIELPQGEDIRIGIPHALEMPAAEVAAFGQLFADYELLQPFAQIGRDTYTLTPDELALDKLLRWNGTVVQSARMLGLINKGWRLGESAGKGMHDIINKPVGAAQVIQLMFGPGIYAGGIGTDNQTLQEVTSGAMNSWGSIDKPAVLSSLDPITASELIRDMEYLRST